MKELTGLAPLFAVVVSLVFMVLFAWRHELHSMWKKVQERKKRKTIAKARKIGPLLRVNRINNVVAICSEEDFRSAYERYRKDVEEGKIKASERVVLKVLPTFTFWKSYGAQTMMHTGGSKDGETFAAPIFERILGVTAEEMDSLGDACKEKVMRSLIIEDGRLFVPFAGGVSEEQEKFYGKKSLDDFREFLRNILEETEEKDRPRQVVGGIL